MTKSTLEYPSDWDSLYHARGEEISEYRPIFTGDVFQETVALGSPELQTVIILQHPCALRSDGVHLHPQIMVADVTPYDLIPEKMWAKGHFGKMPLPKLRNDSSSHCAANFTVPRIVNADKLDLNNRIACLSQIGVNLLLQRWVHHNSRAIVLTHTYQECSSPAYEESELLEEWCEERVSEERPLQSSQKEALDWLRDNFTSEITRQKALENPQNRSAIRREMRNYLKSLEGN